jgi:hypothetical protein
MARKRVFETPRQTILIVTASEAEALYFSQMRKDCRYSNMTVVWQEEFRDFHHLIMLTARQRTTGGFSSAWLVFGLDDLGLTPADVKKEMEYAQRRKVKLAWNNPSLPLWYLLHLQAPRGFVGDPKVIEQALRRELPSYSNDPSYLLDEGMSLHYQLFSAKSKAAVNASAYNTATEVSLGLAPTNMIVLHNDITEICGLADLTHNQKRLGLGQKNG